MTIDEIVANTIAVTLSVNVDEVSANEKLCDSLGVDSTEMVNIILSLEKQFGIHIDDKVITKRSTPKEIASFIERVRAKI